MGIYQLSQHLGHTSVKTTEIYLAFLTPEQQAATKLGEDTFGDTSTRQHDKSGKISA
jgi:integrase/recombinase XerD